MKQTITEAIITILSFLWINSVWAYDCSSLQEWDRQVTYQVGDQVQYNGSAYKAIAVAKRQDRPDQGDPWEFIESCGTGGGGVEPQQLSIYGVWHCGNHYCDWSDPDYTPSSVEFNEANQWIIEGNNGNPSVNLVVLSFLEPLELLNSTNYDTCNDVLPYGADKPNGVPVAMTKTVVDYFKSRGIRVMLSMGGVTYTESWNIALTTNPVRLACLASKAVETLGADGLEIDWENGTPDDNELAGIETFIDTYNDLSDTLLTLDLAVGDRYLQELSRRAAADWLPSGKIAYINAMVPRGEPSTDQWQEHVDGKLNYNPPILPKAPAKIVVSLWLTNSNRPNDNCVDFDSSSQFEKANYVQTVAPSPNYLDCPPEGCSQGFLGYMFWAAGCPSTRNVCTTPPNTCEGGMGAGASYFNIPLPIGTLRAD